MFRMAKYMVMFFHFCIYTDRYFVYIVKNRHTS